jgi:hypothetical protein
VLLFYTLLQALHFGHLLCILKQSLGTWQHRFQWIG